MLVARNGEFSQKRDLHIGGLGANARAEFATVADSKARVALTRSRPFLQQAREAVQNANYALRGNPWAALGLGAALGLTVGYLLSRRT
jgi:ElaB/YqjD/DUF883 family membrane-anchored ribosome-binding protein